MSALRVCTLYSGSSGNASYVRYGDTCLLIDAGRSARALERALLSAGGEIRAINAIFVTHEHTDHISALEVISKKYRIPVHMTSPSAARCVAAGSALSGTVHEHPPLFCERVGDCEISSFITPHDSALCVGYRIRCADGDAGVATDIGHMTPELLAALSGCREVVLESNHDTELLACGSYPYPLKRRILSERGHLSNPDCAAAAARLAQTGTEGLILAHLSRENNRPELALAATREALDRVGAKVRVAVASPTEVTFAGALSC